MDEMEVFPVVLRMALSAMVAIGEFRMKATVLGQFFRDFRVTLLASQDGRSLPCFVTAGALGWPAQKLMCLRERPRRYLGANTRREQHYRHQHERGPFSRPVYGSLRKPPSATVSSRNGYGSPPAVG